MQRQKVEQLEHEGRAARMVERVAGTLPDDLFRPLTLGQGIYYLITGIWPLVHMPSFLRLTGSKTDLWLVRTVGVLITAIGAVLTSASLRNKRIMEIPLLGAGSAIGLMAIDIVYVARRRIPPIYLVDTLAELPLIAGWFIAGIRMNRSAAGPQQPSVTGGVEQQEEQHAVR